MAKDALGQTLNVGDRVQVTGTIVSIYPETGPETEQFTCVVIHTDHNVFEGSPDVSLSAGHFELVARPASQEIEEALSPDKFKE